MDLKEVNVQPYQPKSGDRLIVRCANVLTYEQKCRIRDAIYKWAGCDVHILIVDGLLRLDVESDLGDKQEGLYK